jgi:hypothetical protein
MSVGDYIADTLTMGGATIKQQEMGMALRTTVRTAWKFVPRCLAFFSLESAPVLLGTKC